MPHYPLIRPGLAALAAAVAGAVLYAAPATAAPAAERVAARAGPITRFTGTVNADNAGRFISAIADADGRIVTVRASVEPATEKDWAASRYLTIVDDGLVVSVKDESDGGWEMVIPPGGFRREKERFVIDGVFIARLSGPLQGVFSVGLEIPGHDKAF
ncbi:MAG: hypothetical protein LBV50_01045 [Novosphingobium sp.]|jgi:uncharacterized protein YraI|nr:hypothetical protein [Novosphingobium sp.]